MAMTVDTHSGSRHGSERTDHAGSRSGIRVVLEWVLVILVSAGLLAAYLSAVRETPAETPALETRSVLVRQGDSLWSLAREYPVPGLTTTQTLEYIAAINHLSPATLAAGTVIEVPRATAAVNVEVASR